SRASAPLPMGLAPQHCRGNATAHPRSVASSYFQWIIFAVSRRLDLVEVGRFCGPGKARIARSVPAARQVDQLVAAKRDDSVVVAIEQLRRRDEKILAAKVGDRVARNGSQRVH